MAGGRPDLMRFVIDTSSVGNIILPDERGRVSAAFEDFMLDAVLVQPAHWPIEIAGLVLKATRRERLPVSARALAREAIKLLGEALCGFIVRPGVAARDCAH
jgi:hypothetical protein